MTNIIFSRKEFEKHMKTTKEIQEKITLFGTPLESISQENIEIEVLSNRPDLISLEGFMRSFKKFIGKEPGLKKYDSKKPEKNYRVYVDKSVKEMRPYVSCAIIKNISLNEEKLKDIINLQEKLALTLGRNRKKIAIGIYPLDKITFPLYYTSKEPKDIKYTPLGADRELTADEILMLHPTGRKYEHLLKNQKKYPIFIDSTKKIISTSLAESGGVIYQIEIIDKEKYNSPNLTNQKIKISLKNTNKLLGLNLTENQISQFLGKMGHNYKNGVAEIAPWRIDILHEVDLIEDIAIAYGYNNFIPEIPNISTSGQESKESIIKRKISEILIGLELLEISTYHLIKPEEVENYNIKDALELLDSKSEYKYLRPNLLIPMLRISSENKDAEYPQKLFEIGRVFNKNVQKENGIEENDNLILSIAPANATEIKKHLDYLFKMLGLEYSIKEITKPHLIDGRTCAIILNNKQIGCFGEVHPNTLRKQGIQMPTALAEISLDEIYKIIY